MNPTNFMSTRSQNGLVARKRLFSSAHFYSQNNFSEEENLANFGACYTPYGHGHNYVLEVFVEGPIDTQTRLVLNLDDLDEILKTVTAPLDHHHLNFDVAAFKDLVPTTENIAVYLRNGVIEILSKRFPALKLNRVRLYETDDLWVEILG